MKVHGWKAGDTDGQLARRCRTGDPRTSREWATVVGAVAGLAVAGIALIHAVDLRQAALIVATSDVRWLLVGAFLSFLSIAVTAAIWGVLLHQTESGIRWSWIAFWHGRTVAAGQVIPGGAAGDAVRIIAGRRVVPTSPAVASTLATRLAGGLGLAVWGVVGAVLLRGSLGTSPLLAACAITGLLLLASTLILCGDLWVERLGRPRHGWGERIHRQLAAVASPMAGYRRDPWLVAQSALLGIASWALNLAALTFLGRAVGVAVGWEVFAVLVPTTLTATLIPLSVNGIGVREGILIALLGHAGVPMASAAALAVLVDLQMLPFAAAGGLLWLLPEPASHAAVPAGPPHLAPSAVAAAIS